MGTPLPFFNSNAKACLLGTDFLWYVRLVFAYQRRCDCIDRWLEYPEVFSKEGRAAIAYTEAVDEGDCGGSCPMD